MSPDELAATTLDDVKAAFREWVEVTGVFPLDCGWFWECESFLDDVASLSAPSPAPAQKTELVPVAWRWRYSDTDVWRGSRHQAPDVWRVQTIDPNWLAGRGYPVEPLVRLSDAAAALSEERKRADAAEAENFVLAANQCEGPMIGDEHGHFSCAKVEALTAERDGAYRAIERDRSRVADALNAITDEVARRSWLCNPGRGSYEWDDERYQQEFSQALDAIGAATDALKKVAGDWSYSPMTDPEIRVARIDWQARAEAAERRLAEATVERDKAWRKVAAAEKIHGSINGTLQALFGETNGQIIARAVAAEVRAEAAEATVGRLRAALEPFAEAGDDLDETDEDRREVWDHHTAMSIHLGDLRRARAALQESTDG